jgi:Acyl-CoA carboxylase epsilon subunit
VSGEDDVVLRVVSGHPTEEELAALLAALSVTAAGSAPPPASSAGTGWSAHRRRVAAPLVAGPGAWQDSARPG